MHCHIILKVSVLYLCLQFTQSWQLAHTKDQFLSLVNTFQYEKIRVRRGQEDQDDSLQSISSTKIPVEESETSKLSENPVKEKKPEQFEERYESISQILLFFMSCLRDQSSHSIMQYMYRTN